VIAKISIVAEIKFLLLQTHGGTRYLSWWA